MKRYLLGVVLLSGCAAGDIAVGATVTDHALGEVIHEHAHNCMCVPDGRTKQWFWCDESGKRAMTAGNTPAALCARRTAENCARSSKRPRPRAPAAPLRPRHALQIKGVLHRR